MLKKGDYVIAFSSNPGAVISYSITNESAICVVTRDQKDSTIYVRNVATVYHTDIFKPDVLKSILINWYNPMDVAASKFIKLHFTEENAIDLNKLIADLIEKRPDLEKLKSERVSKTHFKVKTINDRTITLENGTNITLPSIASSMGISCGVIALHPVENLLKKLSSSPSGDSRLTENVFKFLVNYNNGNLDTDNNRLIIPLDDFRKVLREVYFKPSGKRHIIMSVPVKTFTNLSCNYQKLFEGMDYVVQEGLNTNSGNVIATFVFNNDLS